MPAAQIPSLIAALSHPSSVPMLGLYVAGEWTEASDGRTFESFEPATGRV